jgi:hypothetical protein
LNESDLFGDTPTRSPLGELRALGVDEATLKRFAQFEVMMQVQARDGGTKPQIGHLQFIGNAGTGKTSAARLMGRFFHAIGVLARDHVEETNGLDLTGAVVGQTKDVVQERLEAAAGGVLFVDEAYQLGEGQYGAEAITTLVQLMTEPRYDRDKTLIIFAGYSGPMAELMRTNQGLASRFKQRVEFADWSPERCAALLARLAQDEALALASSAQARVLERFGEISDLPHWANARDVRTLFDEARGERAVRVASGPEQTPTLTADDLAAAFDKMLAARRGMAVGGWKREVELPHTARPLLASAERAAESADVVHRHSQKVAPASSAACDVEVDEEAAVLAADQVLLGDAQRELQALAEPLKAMKTLSREAAGEDSLEAALERGLKDDPDSIVGLVDRDLDHPGVRRAVEETIARQIARGMPPEEARAIVEREATARLKHARSAREVRRRLAEKLKRLVPIYTCGYCGRPWGSGPGRCTYMGPILAGWKSASND